MSDAESESENAEFENAESEDAESENAYGFIDWRIDATGPARSQATLHESLHADLNDSTGYGALLHAVAYLARHATTRDRYAPMLERLEGRSRRTHESFATSLGILIQDPSLRSVPSESDHGKGRDLLEHYPDYRTYFQVGANLSRGFAGRFLRYHAITSALRYCMQSRLIERVVEKGLDSFDTDEMRWHEAPDERLRWVQRVATPSFWQETLASARACAPHLTGWAALDDEETAARDGIFSDSVQTAHNPENDGLSDYVMRTFHEALDRALSPRNLSSLSFDGHIPLVPPLLDQAYRILPPSESDGRILRARGDETVDELAVRQFENERLFLSSDAYEAYLLRPSALPSIDAATLASGDGEDRHVFVAVRLAHRMLEQYAFSAADHAWLEARGRSPVVAIRRSRLDADPETGETGRRVVEHIVFEDPDELTRMVGGAPPDVRWLCSFSMAAAGDDDWSARWYRALDACFRMVGLFDLSPFAHFDRWNNQDAFDVHIGRIDVQLAEEAHYAFACLPDTGRSPVFLAPCSEIVASSVIHYVREVMAPAHRFVESDAFIRTRRWPLLVTLSHLFREERIFDFGAGHRLPPAEQRGHGSLAGRGEP